MGSAGGNFLPSGRGAEEETPPLLGHFHGYPDVSITAVTMPPCGEERGLAVVSMPQDAYPGLGQPASGLLL